MTDELELPGPAWRLKEILIPDSPHALAKPWVVYQYATLRTNQELIISTYTDGTFCAYTTGGQGKNVTNRLPQSRWTDIYSKAIAGQALLGRKPEIIEQIF